MLKKLLLGFSATAFVSALALLMADPPTPVAAAAMDKRFCKIPCDAQCECEAHPIGDGRCGPVYPPPTAWCVCNGMMGATDFVEFGPSHYTRKVTEPDGFFDGITRMSANPARLKQFMDQFAID